MFVAECLCVCVSVYMYECGEGEKGERGRRVLRL